MRRLLPAVLVAILLTRFLPIWTPVYAAIALVNTDKGGTAANSSSEVTGGVSATAGNLLVVMIAIANNALTVSSITDTAGNTYTQCSGALIQSQSSVGTLDIWYAKNILGNATNVVTVNYSALSQFGGSIKVHQYSGADTTSPFETATTGSATAATAVTSSSFSPAASGNVNVAHADTSLVTPTWTAGTNYTLQVNQSTDDSQSEDRLNAPSGVQTASFTVSLSATIEMSVASFKVAGGAAVAGCKNGVALLGAGCH
jgi:hypothetical protein